MYDVAIIGGGASGTALLYALSHYTDIPRLALLEKYDELGAVNSNARNNSQTLHVGDIETNYSLEKVRQVKPAAMMVPRYTARLPMAEKDKILRRTQKMVLAVGTDEVATLEKRYTELKPLFPELQKLDREGIARLEPTVVQGRNADEPILALHNPEGYTVDFGELASSFVRHAKEVQKTVDVLLGHAVSTINRRSDGGFDLVTPKGTISAKTVVVDADAFSLSFAKAMGYGHEYSLIPIAGTFYFSKSKLLNGKVYTLQEPKLPFAAVHGDPDMKADGQTRWGPTARFWPVLEARKFSTALDYFRSAGLGRLATWKSFLSILLEPIRFFYLVRNVFYEVPLIGRFLFADAVRKIVPSVRAFDLRIARGFGGMRLQRVDVRTSELQLGEGKIVGDRILFNMTPSPGASVALYNAMRDAEQVVTFLDNAFTFDRARMAADFYDEQETPAEFADVSMKHGYSS